jgi:hypothetical protein
MERVNTTTCLILYNRKDINKGGSRMKFNNTPKSFYVQARPRTRPLPGGVEWVQNGADGVRKAEDRRRGWRGREE